MTYATQREAGIRERLRLLTQDYSRAELAARSGFPKTTVSYFLRDQPISASFCAALARNLGINPKWILVGVGEVYAGMSTSRGDRIVDDLFLLVDARNSVLKQRLGALEIGSVAALLLESSTLRQEYEKANADLNRAVVDICVLLSDLAYRYSHAIAYVTSRSVLAVGERLATLTADHAIHADLATVRSHLENSSGHPAESIVASQKALKLTMASRVRDISAEIGQVADFVISTNVAGRSHIAYRVAESMLAHYKHDVAGKNPQCVRLIAYRGSLGPHVGKRADRSFRDLALAYSSLKEPYKSAMRILYLTAVLDIGYVTPKEMASAERRNLSIYRLLTRELLFQVIFRYSATSERLADLKMIERVFLSAKGKLQDERALLARLHGRCVIDALEGRVKRAVVTMERSIFVRRHCEAVDEMQWLYAMAARCQVLRLAGQTNRAHRLLVETDRQLEDRVSVYPLVVRALHYRNALYLIQNKRHPLLKRAREFYRTLLANGYHGYRDALVQSCVKL